MTQSILNPDHVIPFINWPNTDTYHNLKKMPEYSRQSPAIAKTKHSTNTNLRPFTSLKGTNVKPPTNTPTAKAPWTKDLRCSFSQ